MECIGIAAEVSIIHRLETGRDKEVEMGGLWGRWYNPSSDGKRQEQEVPVCTAQLYGIGGIGRSGKASSSRESLNLSGVKVKANEPYHQP